MGLALAAIYTPFVLVGLFVLASVDCAHCKHTFWKLLPIGPGFALADMASRFHHALRFPEWGIFTGAGIITVAHVVFLSYGMVRTSWPNAWLGWSSAFYLGLALLTIAILRV